MTYLTRTRLSALASAILAIFAQPATAVGVNWTDTTGFWDVATNWSSNPLLPGATDDVVIDVAGVQTITHRSGTDTINSLSMPGDDILAITGGALTVNNAYSNNANTNISAGTLTLNGTSNTATLTQTGGTLGGTGTLTVVGLTTLTGGTQTDAGTSQFNGAVDILGNGSRTLTGGRTMNTAAVTTWGGNTSTGGNAIAFTFGATLNNSGTWNDANTFDSSVGGITGAGAKIFNNTGTYNKIGDTTTVIYAALNNTGTVNINAGRLNVYGNLYADSTSTGTFNIASGTTLSFGNGGASAGLATLDSVTFGGTGTLLIDAANSGGSDVRMVGISGHAGNLTIASGTLQLDGIFGVPTYTQTGGTLGGTGTLTVVGLTTLTGGTQTDAGTSQFIGAVDILGNGSRTLTGGRTMNTAAVTTWGGNTSTGGNAIAFTFGATLNNSGTWNDINTFDSTLGGITGVGAKVFNNTGTYNKLGDTTTDIYAALNNTGTVNVNAGRLNVYGNLYADSTSTGTFNIAAGTTLSFGVGGASSGVATLDSVTFGGTGTLLIDAYNSGGSDVVMLGSSSHAGNLTIASGTLQLDGIFSVPTYTQTGGALSGTGTLTVDGLATLTGGTQTGAGTSQFNGAVDILGNGSRTLTGGRTMNTAAITTWGGNTSPGGNAIAFTFGATINNSGTWNDINTFDSTLGGITGVGAKVFNNTGTYNKLGDTTTDIYAALNNTGTVNVNAGQLNVYGNAYADNTSTGTFNIAAGTTLSFGVGGASSGVATLNNVTFGGTGTLLIDAYNSGGSDVVMLGSSSHAGNLTIASGTLQLDGIFSVPTYTQTGGALSGTGTLTVDGLATLTGGTQTGAGTSQFNGAVDILGNGSRTLTGGRTMNTAAITTWGGNTSPGGNAIAFTFGATINNSGTWNDINTFDSTLGGITGVGAKVFNNTGTYNKLGDTTTDIYAALNNTGTVNVNAGQLNVYGNAYADNTSTGTFNIAAGTTLSFGVGGASSGVATLNNVTFGGTGTLLIDAYNSGGSDVVMLGSSSHAGNLTIASGTLQLDGIFSVASYTQTKGTLTGSGTLIVNGLATFMDPQLTGTGTSQFNGNVDILGNVSLTLSGGHIMNTAATTTWGGSTAANGNDIAFAGSATINNSGTWNDTNAFDNSLGSGVAGTKVFNNSGIYNKQGAATTSVQVSFNNSGLLDAQAGTLVMTQGIQGPTGTLQLSGGIVNLQATSATGNLFHNTNAANSLILGANNITVSTDYNNANFGIGNAFDRYANVSHTTGQILAAGDVAQAITGTGVTNGSTATPTLTIGNVHVGTNTVNFQVANTGTTGPSLRGAIQTSVNGGNITDPNISVTPQNWGPVAPGSTSGNVDVSFNAGSAGTLSLLPNQQIHIENNFDNVAGQNLIITLGSGAAAYNLAAGAATPTPVTIGNQRVSGTGSQVLSVSNTAPSGSFTEVLNASFGTNTGAATNNGGAISGGFGAGGVVAGASNNSAMSVGVDATSAGAKSGTVTLNYVSNGTGTSGLGNTTLGSQTINVSGNVYQVAAGAIQTAALNFGTVQVGQSVSQNLVIANTASGAAGYVEDLNANFGGTSGTGASLISGTGSLNGILAGTNSTAANGTMTVSVDTSAAGTVAGNIAVNFVSAGAVNGVSNGLGTLGVGSASYGVSGLIQANVVNQASPVINNSPINLGNVRVGATSPTGLVNITNQATTAPQAALNASISGNGGITASGSFNLLAPGATDSTSLQVGMDTGMAGNQSGTATLSLVSDASNIGGCAPNCQLTLLSQDVTVNGAVYRMANNAGNPTQVTSTVTVAARVGDAVSANQAVSITNTSPDIYTEGLTVGVASTNGNAQSNGGSIANLAAQGTDSSSIKVGLNSTATAGTTNGQVTLGLTSNGLIDNAAPAAVGQAIVNVVGKVYQQAVGAVNTALIDFGIVRVNSTPSAQNINISNTAEITALNDTLNATVSGLSGPFSGDSQVSGIAAQGSGNAGVALNTATAGIFSQTALVALLSLDPDLADVSAGANAQVSVQAQVNNLANAIFGLGSGAGSLSGGGASYTLDLGNILQGSLLSSSLFLENDVSGPADNLRGTFDLIALNDLIASGWNSPDLAAGDSLSGLDLSFLASNLGGFSDSITFSADSWNVDQGGYALGPIKLTIVGNVTQQSSVPEPGSLALVGIALLALVTIRRRSVRQQQL